MWVLKYPNGIKTAGNPTSQRTLDHGHQHGLDYSRSGGRHTSRRSAATLLGKLEADIQGYLDSGSDRRLQTGVLRCLPAQAFPSGFREQAVIPNFRWKAREVGNQASHWEGVRLAKAYFISPMFLVNKLDRLWRPVINPRSLNQHTIARHFKMESIWTTKGLLHKGSPSFAQSRPSRSMNGLQGSFQSLGGTIGFHHGQENPRPWETLCIGRWLKGTMAALGIDVSTFSAHSTRGAATSKARTTGVLTPDILKPANWFSWSTFCHY